MCDCIQQNSEWVIISLYVLIIGGTLVLLHYMRLLHRLQDHNPIRELSPLLTVAQAMSLYGFVVITLITLLFHQLCSLDEKYLIYGLGVLQNYCRGLFIVVTITKACRITVAFRVDLSIKSLWRQCLMGIFKSQVTLLLLSMQFTFLFWTLIYIIMLVTNYDGMTPRIASYEIVNYVGAINNCVEVSLALILIYYNTTQIIQFDAIKYYITIPLMIYSLWLFGNTFLNYSIKECSDHSDCITYPFLWMWISQCLRCCAEFYCTIILPVRNATLMRPAFIPSVVLNEFEYFMRVPICAASFYEYTCHLVTESTQTNYRELLDLWIRLTIRLETQQDPTTIMDMYKSMFQNALDSESPNKLQSRLTQDMEYVFHTHYKQTKAYSYLESVFRQLDTANLNFFKLLIINSYIA